LIGRRERIERRQQIFGRLALKAILDAISLSLFDVTLLGILLHRLLLEVRYDFG